LELGHYPGRDLQVSADSAGQKSKSPLHQRILSGNILIDTTQVATDTIDYVATHTWGNTATSTRIVLIDAATSTAQ
jgi:hypothetical protein